jgi:phage/plasmid-associated DNA primase
MGTAIQRCCILYGAANSGKSTILHVIKGLFNRESTATCPPEQWGDKFAPATLADKLLNIAGELSEKKLIDGKVFKEIIDGMEITAQFKNQQLFQFEPKATHWFASNYLPKTTDSSEGFTRRLLILWFRKPISSDKKVIGLHNQIIWNEREAIAAWAAAAVPRLCAQREPTLPNSHEQLITDLAAENNSVRFFFQRCSRVLTVKKVRMMLKSTVSTVPAAPVQVLGLGKHSVGVRGQIVPKAMVATVETFTAWSSKSLISEDTLYGEYISFCHTMGGVKPVGVRAFRGRVREMEFEHGFEAVPTPDSEAMSDRALIVGVIE